jgi:D-alanine-D-alanine ligase-like ATP-grasp enzyme
LKLFPSGLLVEKYIPGRDVSVPYISGLGENGVLEPLEYVFAKNNDNAIYDYELKNHEDETVSVRCPAQPPPAPMPSACWSLVAPAFWAPQPSRLPCVGAFM